MNPQSDAHTPPNLPWHIVEFPNEGFSVLDKKGIEIFDDGSAGGEYQNKCLIANAAFIVRAVNAHEELMEALKGAVRAIEYLSGTTKYSLLYNAAREAIAKAEATC